MMRESSDSPAPHVETWWLDARERSASFLRKCFCSNQQEPRDLQEPVHDVFARTSQRDNHTDASDRWRGRERDVINQIESGTLPSSFIFTFPLSLSCASAPEPTALTFLHPKAATVGHCRTDERHYDLMIGVPCCAHTTITSKKN